MEFHVKHGSRVMGVAQYLDEAMEFGERITGWYSDTIVWAPNGYMLKKESGEPTGWKIEKVVAVA